MVGQVARRRAARISFLRSVDDKRLSWCGDRNLEWRWSGVAVSFDFSVEQKEHWLDRDKCGRGLPRNTRNRRKQMNAVCAESGFFFWLSAGGQTIPDTGVVSLLMWRHQSSPPTLRRWKPRLISCFLSAIRSDSAFVACQSLLPPTRGRWRAWGLLCLVSFGFSVVASDRLGVGGELGISLFGVF